MSIGRVGKRFSEQARAIRKIRRSQGKTSGWVKGYRPSAKSFGKH
jgi:hypothetical protein